MRLILHYFSLVCVSILADLLNYFLAPIAVLFSSKEGWLPSWLSWFQTPDNSLDGDKGWCIKSRPYLLEDSAFKKYINRVAWLYRNSMYGFAISVLGISAKSSDRLVVIGDPKVSNRPLLAGLVRRYLYRDSKVIAFQFYYVKPYSATRCIRINLGWKLWGIRAGAASQCQLVHSPSFTMGYTKKVT